MSKKFFEAKCKELESAGWVLDTYEPENKFAVYRKDGRSQTIGLRK